MKTVLKNTTICLVTALLIGCGASNKIKEPTASSRALDEMVAKEQFALEMEWVRPTATTALNSVMLDGMIPNGNSAAQINIMGSGYFFKMEGDSISADLPYYGERQMGGGYGTNNGIKFEGVPDDLKVEKDETKLGYDITFTISEQSESFRCRLELFSNLTGTFLVNSSHRFTIRYNGKVSVLNSEENPAK